MQEREVGGVMIDTRQTIDVFVGIHDDCIGVSMAKLRICSAISSFFGWFEKTHNIPLLTGKTVSYFPALDETTTNNRMCGKKIPGYKFWTDRTWFEFLRLGPLMLMLVFGCIILLFVPNHMKNKEWPNGWTAWFSHSHQHDIMYNCNPVRLNRKREVMVWLVYGLQRRIQFVSSEKESSARPDWHRNNYSPVTSSIISCLLSCLMLSTGYPFRKEWEEVKVKNKKTRLVSECVRFLPDSW